MNHPQRFNYQKKYLTKEKLLPLKKKLAGYHYEARHVNECLKKGLIESPVMTHADTLLLMEILDRIRKKARIEYPADQL